MNSNGSRLWPLTGSPGYFLFRSSSRRLNSRFLSSSDICALSSPSPGRPWRLLDCRPLSNGREPAFDIGEVVEVLSLPFLARDPGPGGDVRDRVLAREIFVSRRAACPAPGTGAHFLPEPVHGVLDLLRRVPQEVVRLAGASGPGRQPASTPTAARRTCRACRAAGTCRSSRPGTRGSPRTRRSTIGPPSTSRSTIAGILRFGLIASYSGVELVALVDVDGNDAVRERALLEHDRDLLAVARRPDIRVNQLKTPSNPLHQGERSRRAYLTRRRIHPTLDHRLG